MRTLGVDPGTAILGFGVVDGDDEPHLVDFGAIMTSSSDPMERRLLLLYEGISDVISRHQPDVLAVEQLFFARNVTNAIAVGQARGVVLLAAAQHNMAVHEYKPNEVKLTVAGYGGAGKHQVQEMVRITLDLDDIPRPDDAADALAVAICHVFNNRLTSIIERS